MVPLAAERGDREAMFALAMFQMGGRGGPRPRRRRHSSAAAAKLGHAAAAYNLALLYIEGQFPQDFTRAAELLRTAADAGNPEAQYAWRRSTRTAAAYRKTRARRRGCSARARSPATPTPRSNTASRCSTAPASPRTKRRRRLFRSRRRGRAARSRRTGWHACMRPDAACNADPVEAARWHLIARAGGASDLFLEDYLRKMKPHGSRHGRRQGQALDRAHAERPDPPSRRRRPNSTRPQPAKP